MTTTRQNLPPPNSANNGKWLRTTSGAYAWTAIAHGDVSGLGGAAVLNVGTITGTVAAGDDARFGGLDATGIVSGKIPKADGANNWAWSDDATGIAIGSVHAYDLTQGLRDRLEKKAVTTLDGSSTGYWTTPDTAVFDITTGIDLRIHCESVPWARTSGQSLISKWNATGNQRSYRFLVSSSAKLVFVYSTTGSNSIQITSGTTLDALGLSGKDAWLRVVADPTAGTSGHALATFYWSTDGATWSMIDAVSGSLAGPWFSGSARVLIGSDDSAGGFQSFFTGTLYQAEIRDGTATLVEDFIADALEGGATSLVGTNGHTWTAGATATVTLIPGDVPTLETLLGWFDTSAYGAVCDLKRPSQCSTTSGSPTVTTTGLIGSDGEAGKLAMVVGAGAVVTTNTNGSMNAAASPAADKNILTGSGFTRACLGRWVSVTGVGTAGATKTGRVLGIIDSTHIRVSFVAVTTASSQTYTISDTLFGTVIASTSTTLTLDTNAGTTQASAEVWVGTDDSVAIQAAITAGEATGSNGYTLYHKGPSAIGTGLLMTKPCSLVGHGSPGYSGTLAHGTVRLRPMVAGLVALTIGSATTTLGIRGSMTSGSGVLTDPTAHFLTTTLAGRSAYVMGAATQTGSDTQAWLETTITSVDSDTQITLTAHAGQTITDTVYTLGQGENVAFAGGRLNCLHIEGSAGQKCGLHVMNAGGVVADFLTISDYWDGWGVVLDRATGFNSELDWRSPNIVDCHGGIAMFGSSVSFTGMPNIDGLSNLVNTCPGPGSIGIAAHNSSVWSTTFNIQAVETWLRASGSGRVHITAARTECVPLGVVFTTDGTNGNKGSRISFTSWSNTSLGKQGKGLALGSGITHFYFDPGYYLTADVDMYGLCDATSLANTIRTDDQYLSQTYSVSNLASDRTYDANATTTAELADVLGTLIADLRTLGVVK